MILSYGDRRMPKDTFRYFIALNYGMFSFSSSDCF